MQIIGWGIPLRLGGGVTPPEPPQGPYVGPWLYLFPDVYPGGPAIPFETFPGSYTFPSDTTFLSPD